MPKHLVTEMSHGNARHARKILPVLFVRNALRRVITRVIEFGLNEMYPVAVIAGTQVLGMRPDFAQNIKDTQLKNI